MKLYVPKFDWTDAQSWISQIKHFFNFYGTLVHLRLQIATFHFEDVAATWLSSRSSGKYAYASILAYSISRRSSNFLATLYASMNPDTEFLPLGIEEGDTTGVVGPSILYTIWRGDTSKACGGQVC